MTIRKELELAEGERLDPKACLSAKSRGRARAEEECDIRPAFQRDRDRILHSKSFRRLKHKTQVFLSPQGDHYRTRLTHALEVSQNARTVAKALRCNEDLVEAIALGHDLGHTPFGHAGERTLCELCDGGFAHNEQSLRVVDILEKDGEGLNLTFEVRDGILNHRISTVPSTLEGKIVRLSDKIAYINHDIDDAIRAKLLREEDIPSEYRSILGESTRERINTLVHDVIEHSRNADDIRMSGTVFDAMEGLRHFLFEYVYTNPAAKGEEKKVSGLLESLFVYYLKHTELLPYLYAGMIERGEKKDRVICDYIAGMTDQYAAAKYSEYFIPKSWQLY